ncbi:5' nucleotidase, NT5C type, partial [Bacillus mycoides]|uniref:5' nucleotidase, NT5C type n=1 Tax=Bacillus mycoides TaxID=1405 RepID=UPI003A7FCD7E
AINKQFGLKLTLQDITDYNLGKFVDVPEGEFWNWFTVNEVGLYKEVVAADGAFKSLNGWSKQNEIFFISARNERFLEVSEGWLQANGFTYNGIQLVGRTPKIAAIMEKNIDIFFEDKYETAIEVHKVCGIPVILFDTPYNQGYTPSGVIRVSNWEEASEWVNTYLYVGEELDADVG